MNNIEPLQFQKHQHLKIITERGAKYGDAVSMVYIVPEEIPHLTANYPIVLTKDNKTGQFRLAVLLGFEDGENLFLKDNQWQASYIPLNIQRGPFYPALADINGQQVIAVHIDTNHSRVNGDEGENLFEHNGSPSELLNYINTVLTCLTSGQTTGNDFIEKLLQHDLVDPLQVNIEFDNHSKVFLEGIYTINMEKISVLDKEIIRQLNEKNYDRYISAIDSNLSGNLSQLISLKNKKLAALAS